MLPESEANSQVDWTYDPNEPRYCICNQVTPAVTPAVTTVSLASLACHPPSPAGASSCCLL